MNDSREERDRMQTQLLAEGQALRRLARNLLGRDDGADDVVQDACLAALRVPTAAKPRHVGGWLTGVVRHLAQMRRRTEARRAARLVQLAAQHAAAPVGSVEPGDPADIAQQAELVRDLGNAVHALEEPFREAILLRFWRGLTPEAIAHELGVPRNTVRSRLQRGIERLRGQLDRKYGEREGWSVALGALVGARGAATALPVGIGVMLMNTKLLLAAASLVAVAIVVPRIVSSPSPAVPVAATSTSVPATSAVAANETELLAAREPVRVAEPVAPAADQFVIRGRCLDVSGHPVSRCRASLTPGFQLGIVVGAVTSNTMAGVSDADGRFELRFPSQNRGLQLRLQVDGFVALQAYFPELRGGSTHDLGDVVMRAGCVVAGRLVDTLGVPASCCLTFGRLDAPPVADAAVPAPIASANCRSDAGGGYTTGQALAPGSWRVLVQAPQELVDAARTIVIADGQARLELDLEVKAVTAVARGIVVDESQRGLAGVAVAPAHLFGSLAAIVSADDGSFAYPRLEGDRATDAALQLTASGFQFTTATLRFGGEPQRIVMRRCPEVAIEVVRASDGSSVDEYSAHFVATTGNSLERRPVLLPQQPRPGGRASVPDLQPGTYAAWIEPHDEQLAPLLAEFVVAGPAVIRLRAEPRATRLLQVRDQGGAPVVGSKIEVLQRLGGKPADLNTRAFAPARLEEAMTIGAVLVQSGVTDEHGELVLAGAAGTALTVRALGPGHRSALVADVRLGDHADGAPRDATGGASGDASGEATMPRELPPLVLRVDGAASLVGAIEPDGVLSPFGPSTDERRATTGERGREMLRSWMPQVLVRDAHDPDRHFPERAIDGAITDDGTFRIDGIPPGDWQVCFQTRLRVDPTQASFYSLDEPVAMVRGLVAGEERHVTLDLRTLVCGTLRAQVFVDGKPLVSSRVDVITHRAGLQLAGRDTAEAQLPGSTDADGRLLATLPAGEYWIEAAVPGAHGGDVRLHAESGVTVAAGRVTDTTVELRRRTMRVHVLQADGAPAASRRFSVLQGSYMARAGATDGDGWLTIESVRPGSFELVTWPTELAEQNAQTAYIRAHPYPQWLEGMVHLEPLAMPAGQLTAEFERRLPH